MPFCFSLLWFSNNSTFHSLTPKISSFTVFGFGHTCFHISHSLIHTLLDSIFFCHYEAQAQLNLLTPSPPQDAFLSQLTHTHFSSFSCSKVGFGFCTSSKKRLKFACFRSCLFLYFFVVSSLQFVNQIGSFLFLFP